MPVDPHAGTPASGGLANGTYVREQFDALFSPVNPACRVYHNANQSIPNTAATFTTLAFNSERFDNNVMHDTSTNNSRITIKTAGIYYVQVNVFWAAIASTGTRATRLRLNGSTVIAYVEDIPNGGSRGNGQVVSCIYQFALNDYIEVQGMNEVSGGPTSVNIEVQANFSPEFSAHFLST